MDFSGRFNEIIAKRGMTKKGVAMLLGIPYSTFLYKSAHEDAWNVQEFRKLMDVMHLNAEETAFLFPTS